MDKGRAHHGESQSPVQSQFSLLLCVWETPHCGQGGWLPGPRVSSQTPGTGQGKSEASLTSPVQGCLRLKKSFFFFFLMTIISFLLLMVHPFPTPGQDLPWVR